MQRERELFDREDSNWEWPPQRIMSRREMSKLMGAALEIAIVSFSNNLLIALVGKHLCKCLEAQFKAHDVRGKAGNAALER